MTQNISQIQNDAPQSSYEVYPEKNFTLELNMAGILKGLIDEFQIIQTIDEMLPKNHHNTKLGSGELLAGLILSMLSPMEYFGLSGVSKYLDKLPVSGLFDKPNIKSTDFNRFRLGDVLDAIQEYGVTRFAFNVLSKFTDPSQVDTMHLDSTSRHMYKAINDIFKEAQNPGEELDIAVDKYCRKHGYSLDAADELKKFIQPFYADRDNKLLIKQGYSRDHHPELGQVCVHSLTFRVEDMLKCLPAYQFVVSGNRSDKEVFADIAMNHLADIKAVYPNLNTIVADSAASTPGFVIGCKKHDVNVCIRLIDNYSDVKEAINKAVQGEIQLDKEAYSKDGDTRIVELAEVGLHAFTDENTGETVQTKMILCRGNMRDSKTDTFTKQAKKELEKVTRDLKKLNTKPCACEADARKAIENIRKKLKLVSISEPVYEGVFGYKGRGRPKSNAPQELIACKVHAEAFLNQEAIDLAIEKDLFFVLATSDLEMDKIKVYEEYHNQSEVEGCWKDYKTHGIFIDNFFLKNNDRIQALLAVEAIALAILRTLQNRIFKALKEKDLSVTCVSGNETKRPTLKTLYNFFGSKKVNMTINKLAVIVTGSIEKGSMCNVLIEAVGCWSYRYYDYRYYSKYHKDLYEQAEESEKDKV